MKKAINLLCIVFLIMLYHFTNGSNYLLLTVSFSLSIIYYNLFMVLDIKKAICELENKKRYYSRDKVFIFSLIMSLLLGIILMGLSYVIGTIINIKYLNIINMIMTLSVTLNHIVRLYGDYLEIIGYKKIGNRLSNIFCFTEIIFLIIESIFIFKIFNISDFIRVLILYGSSAILFILIILPIYLLVRKTKKRYKKIKERINYKEIFKEIVSGDRGLTIFKIIESSYFYISIILLYFTLINKYNYNYDEVGVIITNNYFYGIIIIYFIYNAFMNYFSRDIKNIENKLVKDKENKECICDFIIKVIRTTLPIVILLLVISYPLSHLLFGVNYNLLFNLIFILLFIILFDAIIQINLSFTGYKNTFIILIIGMIVKLIFEIPLISAIYRTGYAIIFGSVISNIIGFLISIILGYFCLKKKLKLHFLKKFDKFLEIIYENIIFCLILVLFTLIVKPNTESFLSSLLVIIFYTFIAFILFFTGNKLQKNR